MRKKWAFGCMVCYFYKVWPIFPLALSSLFPLRSMCSPSKKCQNGVPATWEMFVLREWEGVRMCWEGEGEKKTEIELLVSLFWAPLRLLQMSICSPPSSKCWGCRWPTEESTYQSLPGHLPICLPIYSSAHLMAIHPVHSTILLPPLHLSDNQSINTSICAPIQQSISPSIYLPIIHPFVYHLSIHPSSHTRLLPSVSSGSIKTALQLFQVPRVDTAGHMFDFQTENRMSFQSICRVSCNHSCDSIVQGKCKIQQERKTIKNTW